MFIMVLECGVYNVFIKGLEPVVYNMFIMALTLLRSALGCVRFAYHLRQWQIEGTGITSHLKALSDKQSLPLRIVCQPAGLPDKVGSHTGTDQVGSHTGTDQVGSHAGTDQVGSHTGKHQMGSHTGTDQVGSHTGRDKVGHTHRYSQTGRQKKEIAENRKLNIHVHY